MEKQKFLILLAGSPGTGKSYLMDLIKDKFEDMYIVTPDEIKVYYAEKLGFDNLEDRANQETTKVWPFYYKALDLYMEAGKKVIGTEYPFSDKQKSKLKNLSDMYGYNIITICLKADFDTLWERRYSRDRDYSRHLSYIMKKYHYGDTLEDREQGTNHITKAEFQNIILDRRYEDFGLGKLYEVDVSDYNKVDYNPLIKDLEKLINND